MKKDKMMTLTEASSFVGLSAATLRKRVKELGLAPNSYRMYLGRSYPIFDVDELKRKISTSKVTGRPKAEKSGSSDFVRIDCWLANIKGVKNASK